ncbi:MAG TPA: hypothetical protein VD930_13105 [Gemmatimonadales bacterium]|nr:hypothetical protein [Gemmatimonadales bacterium]
MTERMTHDSAEQLLPAAALEILEGEELIRVTAHARECAECSRQISSYREVLSRVALTLPLQSRDPTRSARLRARLLERAGGHPSAPRNIQPYSRQRFTGVIGPWAGWALAAGLAGVLLVHHSVHRPVAYGWLVAGILTFLVLALAVYVRHLRTRLLMNERNSDAKTGRDDRSPPFP